MNRTQRGFTMIELMISVAVLAIFSSVALSLGVQAKQEHQMVAAYHQDVRECRAALQSLEADILAARGVEVASDEVTVLVGNQRVVYQLADGRLRVTRSGRERILANCIEALRVSSDRSLVTVQLQLRARSQTAARRAAVVSTSVAMRNWEGSR